MYFGKMINKVSEIEGSYGIASVNYISLVFSDRIYFSVFSVWFPNSTELIIKGIYVIVRIFSQTFLA